MRQSWRNASVHWCHEDCGRHELLWRVKCPCTHPRGKSVCMYRNASSPPAKKKKKKKKKKMSPIFAEGEWVVSWKLHNACVSFSYWCFSMDELRLSWAPSSYSLLLADVGVSFRCMQFIWNCFSANGLCLRSKKRMSCCRRFIVLVRSGPPSMTRRGSSKRRRTACE